MDLDVRFDKEDPILNSILKKLKLYTNERTQIEFELKKEQLQNFISKQVAHDIRSPLAALDMVVSETKAIPEEDRSVIRNATRRIHDIADNLLNKSNSNPGENDIQLDVHMLSALIAPLMAEKRTQFRKHIGVELEADFSKDNYGVFVEVNEVEFKRVLSNIVNNSIEAMNGNGKVHVQSYVDLDRAKIIVQDNGPGIPEEILPKLMQKGATFGKDTGSGLGLFHARESVEAWGGSLSIESKVGEGTSVIIDLPMVKAPSWFLKRLELNPSVDIVILDDDTTIHQVWDSNLSNLDLAGNDIKVLHFSNPHEVRNWYESRDKDRKYQFLFDFEILGSRSTGLDLIEELDLSKNATLVTSHYDNKDVRARCAKINVPLLPKNLAIYVPISIKGEVGVDAVFLDDDMLIRMGWEAAAKEKGINLKTYDDPDALMSELNSFSKNTSFYIDSNLGNDIKGEDIAKTLFDKGYTNLYLATGYDPEDFEEIPFIKGIIGKYAPW